MHGYVPVISWCLAPPVAFVRRLHRAAVFRRLALHGLRTLPVRFAEQSKTAALLASRLAEHTAMLVVLLEAIF